MNKMRIGLVSVLVLAAWLRFYGLDAKSLWYDEAVSANYLQFSLGEIIARSAEPISVHPPLYFVLLKLWTILWGDSELTLRALAAICGVATVTGMYFLVNELVRFPRANAVSPGFAGLMAAGLVALSPLQVHLSQQVRGYSLGTALVVWGGWFLLRALRGGRHRRACWIAAAFSALGACYTHHLAVLVVGAQGLFAAVFLWDAYRGQGRDRRMVDARGNWSDTEPWPVWGIMASAIFAIGYCVPWISTLVAQSETVRNGSGYASFRFELLPDQIFRALYTTFDDYRPYPRVLEWSVVIIVVSILVIMAVRGGWRGWYLVLTGALPPLVMALYSCFSDRSIFHARYLCFAQLSWLGSIAILVSLIQFRLERAILATCVLGLSACASYDGWEYIGRSANPGMRAAAEFVLQQRCSGEPIVVQTPYAFFGMAYYTRGEMRTLLCVTEDGRGNQYGSEHLRESDLITIESLSESSFPGVWLVSCDSFNTHRIVRFEIPSHWEFSGTWSFKQDYSLERPVIITHYKVSEQRWIKGQPPGGIDGIGER